MAKVKFSILIRGNNKAHWLKILLRKIKNQSLQNYEIVFCDNNSTDETLKVLKFIPEGYIIFQFFQQMAADIGRYLLKCKRLELVEDPKRTTPRPPSVC